MRGFQPNAQRGKANPFANGGPVRGPGTGTSDDVQDEVPNGTYIMPADSTQAVGEQQLAAMGGGPRGFAPAQHIRHHAALTQVPLRPTRLRELHAPGHRAAPQPRRWSRSHRQPRQQRLGADESPGLHGLDEE